MALLVKSVKQSYKMCLWTYSSLWWFKPSGTFWFGILNV